MTRSEAPLVVHLRESRAARLKIAVLGIATATEPYGKSRQGTLMRSNASGGPT